MLVVCSSQMRIVDEETREKMLEFLSDKMKEIFFFFTHRQDNDDFLP